MPKNKTTLEGCFGAWFIICAILGLALVGVSIWGFIVLVNWVVSH